MVLAGCGSSAGSSDGAATTVDRTTTTVDRTTAPPTTTTTTAARTTVTGLPSCEALLEEYADRFNMDDLSGAEDFFREYAPYLPPKVRDAVLRIADAYEAADGDPANLDFSDQGLNAEAQIFSDWTNEGCPPG